MSVGIKVGDTITMDGGYVRNPSRWFFQFWKPRYVWSDEPQTFTVIASYP